MQEERFFFQNGGEHLYAVLHAPPQQQGAASTGLVLCHPLLDFDLYEVPWTIRMISGYAREMAATGLPALRFDFRGSGQSDGEFDQLTLGRCVDDLRCAIEVLVQRTGVREVILVGFRLAGTVAMRVAARDPRVQGLALWDPIPDPNANLQAVFRRMRASLLAMGRGGDGSAGRSAMGGEAPGGTWGNMQPGQDRLDAGGYVIGAAFLEEIKTWDYRPDVQAFRGHVLILQMIQGWSGASGIRRALRDLDELYRAAGATSELHEVMDVHPAEWYKQPDYAPVWEATSSWLAQAAVLAR